MEVIGALFVNWDASAVGTWVGAIITAFLTYKIIQQTGRINEEQATLEKKINGQQIVLQKRQIKVDLFPYKRELYLNLYRVMEFSSVLKDTMGLNLNDKTGKEIFTVYEVMKNQYIGDFPSVSRSLREAEYILPSNISPTILNIWKCFDEICAGFFALGNLHMILTDDEMKSAKEHYLKEIYESCEIINSKSGFIQAVMSEELNISNLDR